MALFLLGASLAYLTLSKALQWLISFAGQATAAFTPESYVSLVGLMMAAFGLGFLFPVLLVFLELMDIIDYKQLAGARRYAAVAIVDRRRRHHAERRPHQHAGPGHTDVRVLRDLHRHRLARQAPPGQSGQPGRRHRLTVGPRRIAIVDAVPRARQQAHWCRAP